MVCCPVLTPPSPSFVFEVAAMPDAKEHLPSHSCDLVCILSKNPVHVRNPLSCHSSGGWVTLHHILKSVLLHKGKKIYNSQKFFLSCRVTSLLI